MRKAVLALLVLLAGVGSARAQTFNARSYGSCTWNGVADVAPCVNAAIVAAVAAGPGATVQLPAGTLQFSTPMTNTGPVTIAGQGVGITIIKVRSDNVASVYLYSPSNNITGTVIRDLTFAGASETSAQINPLTQVFHAQDITFERVEWRDAGGICLNGSASNGVKVRGSRVVRCGNRWKTTLSGSNRYAGLSLCCGDLVTWGFNNSITGTYFEDIGLDAINSSYETRTVVSGNTFNLENNQRAQIALSDYPSAVYPLYGVGWTISNNTIEGAQGQCIDAPGLRASTITGNALRKCGGAGVGLFQGTQTISTGSITNGSGGAGTQLTITAITSGPSLSTQEMFVVGDAVGSISGTAVADGTYITVVGTCTGHSPTLPCTATVNTSQNVSSQTLYSGINVRGVTVSGNTAVANGQWASSTWKAGFTLGNGIADTVVVSGNTATDDQVTPTQPYGVAFKTSSAGADWTVRPINVSVTDNRLNDNVTAPLLDVSTATSKVIANNGGLKDVMPTVASAATLVLPLNENVLITGSTTVTSMAGTICWKGRIIGLMSDAATPFTATNNIANALTLTQNGGNTATCDGTNWHLK